MQGRTEEIEFIWNLGCKDEMRWRIGACLRGDCAGAIALKIGDFG
jgi:hypothetical protein